MGTPIKGFNGVLLSGATPINEVRSVQYNVEGDEEDTSVMGTTRTSLVNIKTRGSIEVYTQDLPGTDPAQDAGQALFNIDAVFGLIWRPNGTGSGKPELTGNIRVTSKAVTQEQDGHSTTTFNFEVDGAEEFAEAAQA